MRFPAAQHTPLRASEALAALCRKRALAWHVRGQCNRMYGRNSVGAVHRPLSARLLHWSSSSSHRASSYRAAVAAARCSTCRVTGAWLGLVRPVPLGLDTRKRRATRWERGASTRCCRQPHLCACLGPVGGQLAPCDVSPAESQVELGDGVRGEQLRCQSLRRNERHFLPCRTGAQGHLPHAQRRTPTTTWSSSLWLEHCAPFPLAQMGAVVVASGPSMRCP
jgi:hypothetical protein